MAGVEGNSGYPPLQGLHPKQDVATYLDSEPVPTDLPEMQYSHGVPKLGGSKHLDSLFDELQAKGEVKKWFLGDDYEPVELSKAELDIRNRFGISENPYIVFSPGGSDEIIERIGWGIPYPPTTTKILTLGPCFQNIVNFAERQGAGKGNPFLGYGSLEGMNQQSVYTPMEGRVKSSIKNIHEKRKRKHEKLIYLCNPSTPSGDYLTPASVEDIIANAAEQGIIVVIDEALGDFKPDSESAIQFTEMYPNVMVLRTLSKGLEMPKVKIGYLVASPEVKEIYKSIRRPLDYNSVALNLANYVLEPKIVSDRLEVVRGIIRERKTKLIEALKEAKIHYLPTDIDTPIITIDGLAEGFIEVAHSNSLVIADCENFKLTHPGLTDRFGRLTVVPVEEIQPVVDILKKSINSHQAWLASLTTR